MSDKVGEKNRIKRLQYKKTTTFPFNDRKEYSVEIN